LRGLPWVTVSRRPEQQLETQAEVVSGCSPAWKDMISVLGGQHALRSSAGGPLLRSRPRSVQVCVYRVGASPFEARFVRGGHVSGAAETTLLRGAMAGRAIAGCPRPHRQFAVLQARAYVEIGGCHRVLRPGNGIGQASPAALAVTIR
jgi:hypothetical protein